MFIYYIYYFTLRKNRYILNKKYVSPSRSKSINFLRGKSIFFTKWLSAKYTMVYTTTFSLICINDYVIPLPDPI